jgi:hypothetical protein
MPIRFRCVYCDKLLGIARRKAGAVVNCPQCGQPLIVPTPEPEPEPERTAAPSHAAGPPAGGPDKLFERDDFDVLLEPDATFRTPDPPPAAPRPRPAPNPLPPQTFAAERTLPAARDDFGNIDEPAPARPKERRGIVISKSMLILMILAVIGLMGLAFGGGVLVGKMLTAPPN